MSDHPDWHNVYIYAPNEPDPEHLAVVMAEMRVLGAPIIRAMWSDADAGWQAIEGSHRLAAAHALGVVPYIDVLSAYDVVHHDFDAVESPARVIDVLEAMWRYPSGLAILRFEVVEPAPRRRKRR